MLTRRTTSRRRAVPVVLAIAVTLLASIMLGMASVTAASITPPPSLSAIAIAHNHDGLEAFQINNADQIFHRWQTKAAANTWSAWTQLEGGLHSLAAPANAAPSAGSIRNAAYSQCIDAPRGALNVRLKLAGCSGSGTQQWAFMPTAAANTYVVRNQESGFCMEVNNGTSTPGETVDEFTCNGRASEQWVLEGLTFRHAGTNQCLDTVGGAGSELMQWTCGDAHPANVQSWTTAPPPFTATLSMVEQPQDVGSFVPYVGHYPAFGSVPPFHLIQVRFPQGGFVDQTLFFVKPGHTTEQCADPNAVIPLVEGQSLTPSQITTLYGSSQPHFATLNPLAALACWNGSGPLPGFVNLDITIQND